MPSPSPRKSGQTLIFLMVVMFIGLVVVVWNFDLHRVISAKMRVRTAADAAALSAARWQGKTLNMIGDLNLIQAAMLTEHYGQYQEALEDWQEDTQGLPKNEWPPKPSLTDFIKYDAYEELHELRNRLRFIGPLVAFSVAQHAAFNNGAFHDPELAQDLHDMAAEIRIRTGGQFYDNARKDYADLLDLIAEDGVAVSSYVLPAGLGGHALTRPTFYSAIALALTGNWSGFRNNEYLLENYDDYTYWNSLNLEQLEYNWMLRLKLWSFTTEMVTNTNAPDPDIPAPKVPSVPPSAIPEDGEEFAEELYEYLRSTDVVEQYGRPDYMDVLYKLGTTWHRYHNSWEKQWPRAAFYDDDTDQDEGQRGRFPIRTNVRPIYDYMGAEAGIGIVSSVARGILGSSSNATVDLTYKTKAKAFGYLETDQGLQPPHYFGFVFPAFRDVRLIHSDIGTKVVESAFFQHVTEHLGSYMELGPTAYRPGCRYCRLLAEWEKLDREEGLLWLDRAENDPEGPFKSEDEFSETWGRAGGGASGGS